ncbi:hypothetical protein EST62_11615 [Chlorobaculum sp. 24CR]|uniref:hypothetical protein n=1 Tax=Chlorobaculum sp. 24CR TaxID=2508878 RepID=UPI00100BF414|nr:hypothetical protein [Chlorobaculum sp. 24CR]RXK81596.1 hypothetical protein EST62_11615 [Chlorobaculum sp. 24CR]
MDNLDLQSRMKEKISHAASSGASLFYFFLLGIAVTFLLLIIAIQFGWSTIAGLIFGVAAIGATLFCALLNTVRSTFGKGRSIFLGIIVLYLNLMSALAFSAPDFFSGLSLNKWLALSMIFFAATSGGSLALVSYERAARVVSIVVILVNAMVFVKAENRPQDELLTKIEKIDEENRNERMADSLRIVLNKIKNGALLSELTPREQQIYRQGVQNRDEHGILNRAGERLGDMTTKSAVPDAPSAVPTLKDIPATTIAVTYSPGDDPLSLPDFVIPDNVPNGRYLARVSGALTLIEESGQKHVVPFSNDRTSSGLPFTGIGPYGMVIDAESGLQTNVIKVTAANRQKSRKVVLNLQDWRQQAIASKQLIIEFPEKTLVELIPQ